MSIFKYLTLSHLQKVLSALESRFTGIENDIEDIQEEVSLIDVPTDYQKKSLIVNLSYEYDSNTDDDLPVFDKTYNDIKQAFNEGRRVYLRAIDQEDNSINMLYPFSKDGYGVFFVDIDEEAEGHYSKYYTRFYIDSDNAIYSSWMSFNSSPIYLHYNINDPPQMIFNETITTTFSSSYGGNIVVVNSDLWDYLIENDYDEYTITCQKTGSTANTDSLLCYDKSLYSDYCTICAYPDNTVLIYTPDAAEYTITIRTYVSDIRVEADKDYIHPLQSDWEEDDMGNIRYIANKPAIRAGDGENSIIEGNPELPNDAAIYTVYLTYVSSNGARSVFSYTTEDTLPSALKTYGVAFNPTGDIYYNICDVDSTNNLITLSFASGSSFSNKEIKIYYKYYGSYAQYAHAESSTTAAGRGSHTEGLNTIAVFNSHAEGQLTKAGHPLLGGDHAEGNKTIATGSSSHAEGMSCYAFGASSHVEGRNTIANGNHQHVQGKYNIEDAVGNSCVYAHIVGNGTADNARSNAHTLDWSGNAWYAGKVSAGTVASPANPTADNDLATKAYVDGAVSGAGGGSSTLADLTDTTISSPSDGQVLKYDNTTSKWINSTISTSATVSGLTDTTISNPSNKQVLSYNSTTSKWENTTPVTYALSISNGVITLTGSDSSTSSVTLPIYAGEVTDYWEGGNY